jgi:membrane peptidoglycan carboxypeptidase
LPPAIYLTEDVLFFDHDGIRLGQFKRAMQLNLSEGRYVYGGRSLSKQLVKNLFLHRRKVLSRKLEEAIIAWHLETLVDKERILELYINCIEFGPDVYGVVQAAAFYFDKRPQDLTPLEAAFFASLKTSPRHGGDFYLNKTLPHGRWYHRRQKDIMNMLADSGFISPIEVLAAYPWQPQFVYPPESAKDDFRNRWIQQRRPKRKK